MKKKYLKIKPKFEFKCIKYDGNNSTAIGEMLELCGYEILKVVNEPADGEWEAFLGYYYIDRCNEPRYIEIQKGHYVWIDEMFELNTCTEDYLNDHYEIIE